MTDREFFTRQHSAEFPKFLSVLEAAPGDQLAYRPHPRSRSAEELIGHLIGHEQDLLELADTGSINHRMQVPFGDIREAVAIYRCAHEELQPKLQSLSEEAWTEMGTFSVQGNVLFQAPRRDLAWMLLFDAIHHRGQLSAYLRPMGGKVPAIYGPSADAQVATA